MRAFEYASPTTPEQAVSLLSTTWDRAAVLAGGSDLLSLMKDDVVAPKRLVNIKNIGALQGVTPASGGLRIGALTTMGDLADNQNVARDYPALAAALHEAASPQIRNVATIGGNLCQRPRCWYFRNGMGLLPKSESGQELVTGGENRYHAILGNDGPAKFVSPSSIAPVLIAYNASIRLVSPRGNRDLPLEKFYVIPQKEGQREHDLAPNEIITDIILPPTNGSKVFYYEVRQKATFDWPLALAAVAMNLQGGTISSPRVVLGYAAPKPWVSTEAADALNGKAISAETARAAADAALAPARPLSQNTYKVQLARVALQRAIMQAGGAA